LIAKLYQNKLDQHRGAVRRIIRTGTLISRGIETTPQPEPSLPFRVSLWFKFGWAVIRGNPQINQKDTFSDPNLKVAT